LGAFNILKVSLQCESCRHTYPANIQFKFGHTWQIEYEVGDRVKWGGNDIGFANTPYVKVYGIAESSVCPSCQKANNDEFDMIVKNDLIVGLETLEDINRYLSTRDGNYFVVEES